MVKSNAARHLALVVGVLLCFFVYMGYRIRGGADQRTGPAPDIELADAGLDAAAPSTPANLITMNESRPASLKPPSSPIVAPPSDLSSPAARSGEEAIPDITALLMADGGPAAARPSSGGAVLPPPPSGSIEESSSEGTGLITGLVPAPPTDAATLPIAAPGDSAPPPPIPAGLKPPSAPAPEAPAAKAPAPPRQETPPAPAQAREANAAPVPPPPRTESRAESSAPAQTRPSPGVQPSAAADAVSETLRIYVVRPGDTLNRIAARELGSNTLADNIFLLNRDVIEDPDRLIVGARIRLPVRESLGAPAAPPSAPAANAAAPSAGRAQVHVVARGETLSSIALRYYGASSGWRYLYEANQKSIPNPNQLSVGMQLVIPPYGE